MTQARFLLLARIVRRASSNELEVVLDQQPNGGSAHHGFGTVTTGAPMKPGS
jgi:hypothetical protein